MITEKTRISLNNSTQILLEFHKCNNNIFNNIELLKETLDDAIKASNMNSVEETIAYVHNLESDLYIFIHTWPENSLARVSISTFGNSKGDDACNALKEKLRPYEIITKTISNTWGKTILLDYNCDAKILDQKLLLNSVLTDVIKSSNREPIKILAHMFNPQGATGFGHGCILAEKSKSPLVTTAIGLLSESHIFLHALPDSASALIDISCCGNPKFNDACMVLKEKLKPKNINGELIKYQPGRIETEKYSL